LVKKLQRSEETSLTAGEKKSKLSEEASC